MGFAQLITTCISRKKMFNHFRDNYALLQFSCLKELNHRLVFPTLSNKQIASLTGLFSTVNKLVQRALWSWCWYRFSDLYSKRINSICLSKSAWKELYIRENNNFSYFSTKSEVMYVKVTLFSENRLENLLSITFDFLNALCRIIVIVRY